MTRNLVKLAPVDGITNYVALTIFAILILLVAGWLFFN